MVKITAVLLVTVVCILDFGTCLFYTDSKENDYPRIGKRKRYNDYVDETDFYGRKFRDSIKSMHSLTMNEAVIPSVLLFQFFDIDSEYLWLNLGTILYKNQAIGG